MCTTTHQEAVVGGDGSSSSGYSYTVRVKARGSVAVVSLRCPAIAELQASIASAFELVLLPTHKGMSLSYLHPGGGKAFLDDDMDLLLALTHWRSCPALTVTAVFAEDNTDLPIPESISGLYHEAAEHLRSSHGVTSITPVSLRQAVALLNLPPRRLVTQGLAPHWSLKAQQSPPLSQQQTEAATALPEEDNNADLMSEHEYVSDTESEDGDDLDDNTVVVEEVEYDSTPSAVTLAVPAAGDLSIGYDQQQEEESTTKASNFAIDAAPSAAQSSPSETLDRGDTQVEQASSPSSESVISGDFTHAAAASNSTIATFTETSPLHAALVAGGVSIHPHETDALIHALGVDPPRLVHLGLVKQEIAHAVPTTATDICARPRRSVSRPAGARKPKTIRVPVRLAGSKRRGARSSSSANTNDIFANLIRKSGKLVGEGVVVPWPQLAVSTTAPSQRLRVQTIRGMGSASSRKGMQVRAFSRHGARDNGPASRRQRIVSNPNAGV